MKNSNCRNEHHTWKRGRKIVRCQFCNATCPCREECGHLDCIEARGRDPKCVTCKKPMTEGQRFFVTSRNGWKPMHEACLAQGVA